MSNAFTNTDYNPTPNPNRQKGVRGLEILWRETIPRVFDINFTKPFTEKEWGMLKKLIKNVAPYDAFTILEFVLHDWSGYCNYAEDSAGLKVTPQYPSIRFLLTHCGEATNYWLKYGAESAITSPRLTYPHSPQLKQIDEKPPVLHLPEERSVTIEEIEEIGRIYGLE